MCLPFDRYQVPETVAAAELTWLDMVYVIILPAASRRFIAPPIPFMDELASFFSTPRYTLSLWNSTPNVAGERYVSSRAWIDHPWI
jgi:hypothetical protein